MKQLVSFHFEDNYLIPIYLEGSAYSAGKKIELNNELQLSVMPVNVLHNSIQHVKEELEILELLK